MGRVTWERAGLRPAQPGRRSPTLGSRSVQGEGFRQVRAEDPLTHTGAEVHPELRVSAMLTLLTRRVLGHLASDVSP